MTMMEKAERALKSEGVGMVRDILTWLALGLGAWAMTVLLSVQTDVGILKNTLAIYGADRYRSDEARRDFQLRDLRIDTIEKQTGLREDAIENRLQTLEHSAASNRLEIQQIAPPIRRRTQ